MSPRISRNILISILNVKEKLGVGGGGIDRQ
jgi:hypothetical protein